MRIPLDRDEREELTGTGGSAVYPRPNRIGNGLRRGVGGEMDALRQQTQAGPAADKFVYFRLSAACGLWYRVLPRVANGVEGWSTCRPCGSGALYHSPQAAPASCTQFYQRGLPVPYRLRGESGSHINPLPAIRSRTERRKRGHGKHCIWDH